MISMHPTFDNHMTIFAFFSNAAFDCRTTLAILRMGTNRVVRGGCIVGCLVLCGGVCLAPDLGHRIHQ